jgi:peptidoglycan/LPS O-acetylase OafA/YrhL
MFGTYRTVLALLVVAGHLGPLEQVGPYAVFAFYVLSGYLMTAILQRNYGYSAQGFARYAANRALRILPMYWLAMLLTIAALAVVGEATARAYHPNLGLAVDTPTLWRNLGLVLTVDTPTRWVPPAWALTVELFFYALMGLGLSRWLVSTVLWAGLSVAYTAYLVAGDASFSYRYFPIAAASLPFSVGALVYHLRARQWLPDWPRPWAVLVVFLMMAHVVAAAWGGAEVDRLRFYANVLLAAAATHALAGMVAPRLRRPDAWVGELSYPVYLMHYLAGLVLVMLGVAGQRGEWGFMVAGAVLTLLMAAAAAATLDPSIQAVRARIRQSARASATSAAR